LKSSPPSSETPARGGRAFLYILTAGVFFTALDQTVVVTAIPSMVPDLGIEFRNIDRAAWIVNGFLIGYAVALPVAGRLADIYARWKVFLGALALFVAASVAAALAENLWFLVAARFLQAAGGGALVPVALAQAAQDFGDRRRIVVFGLIIAAAEMGGVLGPFWGAALTQAGGWRWIFIVNPPVVALLALAAYRLRDRTAPAPTGLDWRGAVVAVLALGLLTVGLSRDEAMPLALALGLMAAGVAAIVGFVALQRRIAAPLIDMALFRIRPFSAGTAASLLIGGGLIIPMVNMPLYAATVIERDALGGGILLLKMTIAIPVGAAVGGWVAGRLGNAPVVAVGAVVAGAGLLMASRWGVAVDDAAMTRDLLLAGSGFGLVIAPLAAAVVGGAGRAHAGVGASMVTVSRLLGMMAALAALTPWALRRFNEAAARLPLPIGTGTETEAQMTALSADYEFGIRVAAAGMFADLFLLGAILCWLAVIPALLLGRRSDAGSI
jgi:MFS family permease